MSMILRYENKVNFMVRIISYQVSFLSYSFNYDILGDRIFSDNYYCNTSIQAHLNIKICDLMAWLCKIQIFHYFGEYKYTSTSKHKIH
jgi:hypothetical protein